MLTIFELLKNHYITGQFMNPPDKDLFPKPNMPLDLNMEKSLRKTSEEIRKRDDTKESLEKNSTSKDNNTADKAVERLTKIDPDNESELSQASIYNYAKTINVISIELEKASKDINEAVASNMHKKKQETPNIPILNEGLCNKEISKVLLISRIYTFIQAQLSSDDNSSVDKLIDFESNQFLQVVKTLELSLRIRCEGLLYNFFIIMNSAKWSPGQDLSYQQARCWSLETWEQLKDTLPYKNCYSSHYASLIKII